MSFKFMMNFRRILKLQIALAALVIGGLIVAMAAPAAADPPPWAPAHGYYKNKQKKGHKNKHDYEPTRTVVYRQPFDLDLGRCNRALLGGVLGAAAGAAIGSQIGDGDGRTVAIISGAVLGAVVGGSIGDSMDAVDQQCVGQTLEHTADGESIVWTNGPGNGHYQVTPVKTYQLSGDRYCREYITRAIVDGREQETYGTACRQPDGSWQLGG